MSRTPQSTALMSSLSLPKIGTIIYKDFPPHGSFYGQVVFYTFGGRFCRVAYEDGDCEDLYPHTVFELASPLPPRPFRIPTNLLLPSNTDIASGASMHAQACPFPGAVAPMSAATAFPAAPAASRANQKTQDYKDDEEEDDDNVRRSKRAKSSTVVWFGKDAVKRDNNYIVKGMTYSYGAVDEAGPKPAPSMRKAAPKPPTSSPSKPRKVSPEERARVMLKERIEQNVKDKVQARNAFMYRHADVLKPFCPTSSMPEKPALDAPPNVQREAFQPDTIQAELRDYQLDGLNFMSAMYQQNIGMILGDEMGLGKTLQTISLICLLKEKWNQSGPSLVICPMSVLYSWCNEVEKWAPTLKCLRFHSSNPEALTQQCLLSYDIVVTTYEMISAKHLQRLWSRQFFNLVVLDEGHKIKNATTNISQAVRKLHAECRIILTGTPLANCLTELWALLNFLEPKVFSTSAPFDDAFDLSTNTIDNKKLTQAHALLKVFMLRRLKATVEQKLPPKVETKVICPLSTSQIFWYKALLLKDLSTLANGGAGSKAILNNLVMNLRKACLHPFLFPGVEDNPDETSLEDLIGNSGKLAVLDLLLQSLYKKGHRVTLFSQFTRVLDILDDYCRLRGWKACRLDGGTSRAQRNHIINSFNAPDSDKFIFLMSTRSGGMGINLQTADTCILFDSDWNPQPDIQAMGRTHRLGQKKTVHVYRLCTLGTVEQRMQERAEKKLYLDRMVTRDDTTTMDTSGDDETDKLLSTIRFGCNAIFGSAMKKQELPTLEDIEMITDRSRTEAFSNGKLQGNAELSADKFDATTKMADTMSLCGIDFRRLREENKKRPKDMGSIKDAWKKRQRKNRIKLVAGIGSGYGSALVPVLEANDYALEAGESSVFDRELGGRGVDTRKRKKEKKTFEHQDICQICGDGGDLICCPRCPVSMHLSCSGINRKKGFLWCSHHKCTICEKTASAAGGLLYPCAECPNAYCEDHVNHEGFVILENGCKRMEKLGYHIKNGIYVLCSKQCQSVAASEWGWSREQAKRSACPKALDVSSYFGGDVDDDYSPAEELVEGKRQRKQPVLYKASPDTSPTVVSTASSEVERPRVLPKSPKKAVVARSDSIKENRGFPDSDVIDLTDD